MFEYFGKPLQNKEEVARFLKPETREVACEYKREVW
jgi:hypothetical protein